MTDEGQNPPLLHMVEEDENQKLELDIFAQLGLPQEGSGCGDAKNALRIAYS